MILECPECSTQYELPTSLPEGGTKVRCSSCAHVWHATEADLKELPSDDEAVASGKETSLDDGIPAVSPFETDPLEELDFDEIEDVTDEAVEAVQDDIENLFEEMGGVDAIEDASEEDVDGLLTMPEEEAAEDNSQDDIDNLFDEAVTEAEENSQDDIDGLFDEPAAAAGDDNSQDDIDGLFDEAVAESDDNSQDDIDGLFDEAADKGNETVDVEEDPFKSVAATGESDEPDDEDDAPLVTGPFWRRLDQTTVVGWCCYSIVVVMICVIFISARVPIVRAIPSMASVYSTLGYGINVRGVMFTNVQQRWEVSDNRLQLRVDGEISNLTNSYKSLPPLVLTALSKRKRELFRWVANVRVKPLLPGERAPFVVRFPAPPGEAEHLLIHFER